MLLYQIVLATHAYRSATVRLRAAEDAVVSEREQSHIQAQSGEQIVDVAQQGRGSLTTRSVWPRWHWLWSVQKMKQHPDSDLVAVEKPPDAESEEDETERGG
jgi:hypothetical protein